MLLLLSYSLPLCLRLYVVIVSWFLVPHGQASPHSPFSSSLLLIPSPLVPSHIPLAFSLSSPSFLRLSFVISVFFLPSFLPFSSLPSLYFLSFLLILSRLFSFSQYLFFHPLNLPPHSSLLVFSLLLSPSSLPLRCSPPLSLLSSSTLPSFSFSSLSVPSLPPDAFLLLPPTASDTYTATQD